MAKLLPLLLLLIGTGAGIGAGLMLSAGNPDATADTTVDHAVDQSSSDHAAPTDNASTEKQPGAKGPVGPGNHGKSEDAERDRDAYDYVKLNNQFVVPVVAAERVEALVVISLSIEADPQLRDQIFAREPKIRDAFLQVLFDHSNMGGFQGAFTRSRNLEILRTALTEVAQAEFGAGVHGVLIVEIARQDV